MEIKNSIYFFVDKERRKEGEPVYVSPDGATYHVSGKVRMRVRWNPNRTVAFSIGHRVDLTNWSTEAQRCKRGTTHGKKEVSSFIINNRIQHLEQVAAEIFRWYESRNRIPTPDEFRQLFNKRMGRKPKSLPKAKNFFDYFDEFLQERGSMNHWTAATYQKLDTLKAHLQVFDSNMQLDELGEEKLIRMVEYFQQTGMRNTTIKKELALFRWFMGWAYEKKYTERLDWKYFRPSITTVSQKVIFLTWPELMQLYHYQIPVEEKTLNYVKDLFCLQCFTSLRYSDVYNLKRSQVKEDHLEIVTQKTADSLTIDLNKYSRSILDKYKFMTFKNDKALPSVSTQKMNLYLKQICERVGLDEPVSRVWYIGSTRYEQTRPKYRLVSTHCGRRTFICNSLTMGIPAETVMRWTGHSNYNAMKPYIAIADQERKAAMQKWDKWNDDSF